VLAYGFAYVDGRRFETGLFKGRHAIFSVTTGGTSERFSPDGVYGEIERVLYPVERLLLQYMGFEVLPPFVAYGAPRVDDAQRRVGHAKVDLRSALAATGAGAWSRKV
jgi:NAD(P)H dehydrogenase (quinone)